MHYDYTQSVRNDWAAQKQNTATYSLHHKRINLGFIRMNIHTLYPREKKKKRVYSGGQMR